MADAVTVPQVQPVQPVLRFVRVIPGVLLLAAIGYAGKLLEQNVGAYAKAHHWTFPNIEYVLWAIILGLLISNTVGVPELFRSGVATYEFWLKAGIALLGARFLLGDILKLGGVSLILVAFKIVGPLAFMPFLARVTAREPTISSPNSRPFLPLARRFAASARSSPLKAPLKRTMKIPRFPSRQPAEPTARSVVSL